MPAVSVIVPCRNAQATLERTLQALAAQDLTDPFEVIVVDNGSTDGSAELAERASVTTVVIRQPNVGPAVGRNRGVEAARSPTLAFTDADCEPGPGWLSAGLAALERADVVQGKVVADSTVPREPFDRTLSVPRETGLYETANLFLRRELIERLGGFEGWLEPEARRPIAEDVWLGWRARRAGARTAFCPEALVRHAVFRRGPREYVAERWRRRYFADIVAKIPELRRQFLFARIFLDRRTAAFDLALIAIAVVLARPRPTTAAGGLLAALPYARMLNRRASRWGRRAPLVAVVDVAADAVSLGALMTGSVRRRTPVL